LRELFDVTR